MINSIISKALEDTFTKLINKNTEWSVEDIADWHVPQLPADVLKCAVELPELAMDPTDRPGDDTAVDCIKTNIYYLLVDEINEYLERRI